MPPKKTTRKTTARKPAAKKTAVRKPAAKRPAKKTASRKKADKKLPIGTLIAVIPAILLVAFIALRFSGAEKTVPQTPAKTEPPKTITKTVVEKVETKSVEDTLKLFMFEKGLKYNLLKIKGPEITIGAESEKSAENLTSQLKKYLIKENITVDGQKILTAEDAEGIFNIRFVPPEKVSKPVKKPEPVKEKAAPVKFRAKLAVVIDDCGYSMDLAKDLADVRYPVTFAVIPYTPYGKETALLAKKSGKTLFIHYPMQPKSYPDFDPGKGALFLNMPESLIAAVNKSNFEYFPVRPDGANNHTGSAFTENRHKMEQALRQIKKYTDTFLDSYTSGKSQAYDVCQKLGMRCGVNNVFLDNEEPGLVSISDKKNHVHDQLIYAAKKALSNGNAIAIGHLKTQTVSVLDSTFSQIEKMGVKIVPVKEIMK